MTLEFAGAFRILRGGETPDGKAMVARVFTGREMLAWLARPSLDEARGR
jgi:hypothetical protein